MLSWADGHQTPCCQSHMWYSNLQLIYGYLFSPGGVTYYTSGRKCVNLFPKLDPRIVVVSFRPVCHCRGIVQASDCTSLVQSNVQKEHDLQNLDKKFFILEKDYGQTCWSILIVNKLFSPHKYILHLWHILYTSFMGQFLYGDLYINLLYHKNFLTFYFSFLWSLNFVNHQAL